jgi:hypothetical protein
MGKVFINIFLFCFAFYIWIRISMFIHSLFDDRKVYKYNWEEELNKPMEDNHYNNILDRMQEDNPKLYVPKNWYK